MSAPNLRLWVGHHVLALRNAIYYPAVILEVSNERQCVMVEFKGFRGLATMYQDVFNRGHLSIISDACPKCSEIKVELRVAIKSWSYETNQLFYTPGVVVAVLDNCGRFLVTDLYNMERRVEVGIDDIRVLLPFWWKYAYYSQAQASQQNYVDQNMFRQPQLIPQPQPQVQPQSKRKSQSRAQIQPQAKRKSQPQEQIQPEPEQEWQPQVQFQPKYTPPPPQPTLKQLLHQPQPEQEWQPQVQFQPKYTPPPPQPTLNQLLHQPQPMLPPFSNIFHQPYYAWDQVLPRLPPPYPGDIYRPMNSYINNQVNVEKENVVSQFNYRENIPKPNDYNNYNYNYNYDQKEAYPELLNSKNEHSSVINYNNNQVNDIEKKNEVNLSLNNHFSTNDTRSYSVKAKTIEVPVITKELEMPSGVKVPQVPVKSKVPELLPITTQGQSLPATSKAQVIPTTSKLVELPAEVKSQLHRNPQLQENIVTQSKYREIIPKPVSEPLVPNLQATAKIQPKKRSYTRRKKAEDENTMRRPMNAFMYFAQEHRNALLLQNNKGFDNRHISKILAEKWYQLPPAEKLKYNELAAKAKEEQTKADPKNLSWKRKDNKIRIQCEVSRIEAKISSSDEVSQIEAKVSSSDEEPRLVIDESRINESDDNSSPLFVPKTSNTSQLEKLLRGNSQLPEIDEPKNSNKENILESNNSNLVPNLPPELDSCLPESLYDTTVENFKNVIKSEYCTSSISYNGGSMQQKEEKLLPKEKTLIGEQFFPPDFSVEAVEKTETSEMNALTEAVIKEILISDAYYNNNGHYTRPQKKRMVVLNMFKENGYYPSDQCIEEVMQKHKDIFGNKNGLKTKIREVRQKLLSKIKNGTVPVSPMLKDMIASMIPDGDSPLFTPGTD